MATIEEITQKIRQQVEKATLDTDFSKLIDEQAKMLNSMPKEQLHQWIADTAKANPEIFIDTLKNDLADTDISWTKSSDKLPEQPGKYFVTILGNRNTLDLLEFTGGSWYFGPARLRNDNIWYIEGIVL